MVPLTLLHEWFPWWICISPGLKMLASPGAMAVLARTQPSISARMMARMKRGSILVDWADREMARWRSGSSRMGSEFGMVMLRPE
jgi:hypothetical protein